MSHLSKAVIFLLFLSLIMVKKAGAQETFFPIQSVDTMKISRDVAREKMNDTDFALQIDQVTKKIAETGATHISIATPYDDEFLPFLRKWVSSARKHKLKVWFRGNFSGWEEWFDYPRISREDHLKKTVAFISKNSKLFQDGDILSTCPECENGGPGDPRQTGDVEGFRSFIISEHIESQRAFKKINKNVASNYFSMNGDVAKLIMDRSTTSSLDGIVVIDHYVKTPAKTISDINQLAKQSGGKIVLGEFGVPIPDIHGDMSEEEQAEWINALFIELIKNPHVAGLNYWTSTGSSTELWHSDGTAKKSVSILQIYYSPTYIKGIVIDKFGTPIQDARITTDDYKTSTNNKGEFTLLYVNTLKKSIIIEKSGYSSKKIASEIANQKAIQFFTLEQKLPTVFEQIFRLLMSFYKK